MKCGRFYDQNEILESTGVPHCECGGVIKPDVVLYEESLNQKVLKEAVSFISHADVLIVGGTSLVVYPAAGLIDYYRSDKLVLIYFVMQILAALLVMPFTMLYSYAVNGTIDDTSTAALAPSMLLGFVGMGAYLWRKGYLKGDKRIWSPVSVAYLGWSAVIGLATIFLIDFVMSKLSFLPDWMGATFDVLQSGWLGIICISVLGPVLEEMLFRGAITKVLLQKYSPVKAITPFGAYLRDFSY